MTLWNNILLVSDHAGFELKHNIIQYLSNNYNINDLGVNSKNSVDYPDYAKILASKLMESDMGIAICGSGIGMSIALNRYKYIRAALCHDNEYAKLSREHNNANVLVLGARFIDLSSSIHVIETFIKTKFQMGRHKRRVDKLTNI